LVGNHALWANKLWNAGKVLTDYMDQPELDVFDKCVLELGAGAGTPGIIAGFRGAKKVVITDYPDDFVIENIQYNININFSEENRSSVIAMGHLWGKDIDKILEPIREIGREGYDFIICADCIFNHVCQNDLLKTLKKCLNENGRVFVAFSHHKPKFAERDLAFFTQAEENYQFISTHLFDIQMEPMFKVDYGPAEVRGKVQFYTLEHNKNKEVPVSIMIDD